MKKQRHKTDKWAKMFKKRLGTNPLERIIKFANINYEFHQLIQSKFNKNISFIEYGAGTAFHSFCFNIYGYKGTATDVDDSVLNLIKKTAKKLQINIKIEKQDIINNKIQVKNKTFTFSDGVLEHFTKEEIIKSLKNQKSADYITFSVPTKKAKLDETSYGDEILYPYKEWIKMCKEVYPNSKIEVYPVCSSKLIFIILRKIIPFISEDRSKFNKIIKIINNLLFKIENRYAASIWVLIYNNEKHNTSIK